MPYDSLGIWHDPGNGRFAPRGFSTLKALAFKLIKGGRTRDRVKKSGKGRARVADNMLSRAGIAKGDVIDVVYKNDDYGKVQITSKSGKPRWYDVQWARFDDEYVPDDVVDQPDVTPEPEPVKPKRAGFASRGAHPIVAEKPSYETAAAASVDEVSAEDRQELRSLLDAHSKGDSAAFADDVVPRWNALMKKLNLDPAVFPIDSKQFDNVTTGLTPFVAEKRGRPSALHIVRDADGRGVAIVETMSDPPLQVELEALGFVADIGATVRVGSVVRQAWDEPLLNMYGLSSRLMPAEDSDAAFDIFKRSYNAQRLMTQLNPSGGIPVVSTDDVFMLPPTAVGSIGPGNAYSYDIQPALVRLDGSIYLVGTDRHSPRNAMFDLMTQRQGDAKLIALPDTPENWAKAQLLVSNDAGRSDKMSPKMLWAATTVNPDGTYTVDTGANRSVTFGLDDAYRRLFDQVTLFTAKQDPPNQSSPKPPISKIGSSYPWTHQGSAPDKLPWRPPLSSSRSWWTLVTGQQAETSIDTGVAGLTQTVLSPDFQYPPMDLNDALTTNQDTVRDTIRMSSGFKPQSVISRLDKTFGRVKQQIIFGNDEGITFAVPARPANVNLADLASLEKAMPVLDQQLLKDMTEAWDRLGGERLAIRTISTDAKVDGEWTSVPYDAYQMAPVRPDLPAESEVTSTLPGPMQVAYNEQLYQTADQWFGMFQRGVAKDAVSELSLFDVPTFAPFVNRGASQPIRRDGKITLSGQAPPLADNLDDWVSMYEVAYDPNQQKLYTYKADGDLSSRATMSKVTPDDVRLLARLLVNGTRPSETGKLERRSPLFVKDALALLKAGRVKVDDDFRLYVDTPKGRQTFDSVDDFRDWDSATQITEQADAELSALGGVTAESFSEDAFREVSRRALRIGVDNPKSKLKALKIERNGKWASQGEDLERAKRWLLKFPVGDVALASLMTDLAALPDDPMAKVVVKGAGAEKDIPRGDGVVVTPVADGYEVPAYVAANFYYNRWRQIVMASRNAQNDPGFQQLIDHVDETLKYLRAFRISDTEPGISFNDTMKVAFDDKGSLSKARAIDELTRERFNAGDDWRQVLFGRIADFAADSPDVWSAQMATALLDTQNGSWAQSSQSHFSTMLQYAVMEMTGFTGDDFPEWSDFQNRRQKVNGYAGAYTEGEMMLARLMALSTYTLTQSQLQEMNIGEDDVVFLARGSSEPAWNRAAAAGETVKVSSNPLSANATRTGVANSFGGSITVGYRVPRSRIFSTAHTGPGTYKEAEALVMGDPAGYIGQAKYSPSAPDMTALKKTLSSQVAETEAAGALNIAETVGMTAGDMSLLRLLRNKYTSYPSRQLAGERDTDPIRLLPVRTWSADGGRSDLSDFLAEDDERVERGLTDLGIDLTQVEDVPWSAMDITHEARARWVGQSLAAYVLNAPLEERPEAMTRALAELNGTDFTAPFYVKQDVVPADADWSASQPTAPVQAFNSDYLLRNMSNELSLAGNSQSDVISLAVDPTEVVGPMFQGSGNVLTRQVSDRFPAFTSDYARLRRWGVAGDATVKRIVTNVPTTRPEAVDYIQRRSTELATQAFEQRLGAATGRPARGRDFSLMSDASDGTIFGPVDDRLYVMEAQDGRPNRLTTVDVTDPELAESLRQLRRRVAVPPQVSMYGPTSAATSDTSVATLSEDLGINITLLDSERTYSENADARPDQVWGQAVVYALFDSSLLPGMPKSGLDKGLADEPQRVSFGEAVDADGAVAMPSFDEWLRLLDARTKRLISDRIASDESKGVTVDDRIKEAAAERSVTDNDSFVARLRIIYDQRMASIDNANERRALLQQLVDLAASQGKVLDVDTLERMVQSKASVKS